MAGPSQTGIVDIHVHLNDEPGYLDGLVETARRLGFSTLCLSGTGAYHHHLEDDDVLQAARQHPDLIAPLAFMKHDEWNPKTVEAKRAEGFVGLKTIDPSRDYDDESYFPLYEAAEALRLPILFHTGIKARFPVDKPTIGRTRQMRPVTLDAIARRFPELDLIGAHMGPPWYDEALMVSRVNPNVYMEFSSGSGWQVKGMTPDWFKRALWWDGAWRKVVFASDVHYSRLEWAVDVYRDVLDGAGVSDSDCEAVWNGTLGGILMKLKGADAR